MRCPVQRARCALKIGRRASRTACPRGA
ncbi:DUF1534 domain-containing protein [Pseudomonas syringae]|nr:DUF1534 domain-containing protein [Pseudomonas syringae]NAP17547.1 DUF1534 domain-containing protein [Pseudomonas syringae]NAP22600.1 DUF1534 domain-containing protein [Pseudomonas syringae]NAP48669.1 DUF1534 domain-containing protein [Pseudomonas syringae]NAP82655.1 DUF1534 domain-containing protein [Pseudomonas syringae]